MLPTSWVLSPQSRILSILLPVLDAKCSAASSPRTRQGLLSRSSGQAVLLLQDTASVSLSVVMTTSLSDLKTSVRMETGLQELIALIQCAQADVLSYWLS